MRPGENARFEERAVAPCSAQQCVAHRKFSTIFSCNFHQAARHIHRIAYGCDVVMTGAAEAGGDDRPEMRAGLISKP